ncbi:GL27289 [Drosophila persimilis]|uniref:GL27289 n=1 Tax=Drosophila persimilis TaxID=7234 RepID=B4GZ22_DROPE|nr:GL27289 [Drosophila persimilis]
MSRAAPVKLGKFASMTGHLTNVAMDMSLDMDVDVDMPPTLRRDVYQKLLHGWGQADSGQRAMDNGQRTIFT